MGEQLIPGEMFIAIMEHYKCVLSEHLILNPASIISNMLINEDFVDITIGGMIPYTGWKQWEYRIHNNQLLEHELGLFSALLKAFIALVAIGEATSPNHIHFY